MQEEIVSNSNSASDEFGLPVLIPIQSSEEQHNIQTRVSIETQENEQRTTPGSSQVSVLNIVKCCQLVINFLWLIETHACV